MVMGKASFIGFLIIMLGTISAAGTVSIGNLEKLSLSETNIWDPAISPDGTRIAYVSYDAFQNQTIFVINTDGTGKKAITSDNLKKWGLAWGPDKIAYVSFGKDGLEKIFVINPDGTDNHQLILDNTRQGNAAEDKPPTWADPSWSHDGKNLIYTSLDEIGDPKMYMVNADGTGKRLIFTDNFKQWSPSISPDGKNIVYVSYNDIYNQELFIIDISGTARRQITFDGIKKNNPVWGPGGTIAYVSYENITSSGEKIFAIDQDGTNKRSFVGSDFRQLSPSFSMDGRTFAYAAIDSSGSVKIAVGSVSGSPVVTSTAVAPIPTAAPTTPAVTAASPVPTPAVSETPAGSALTSVVSTMILVLGIIVIVMVILLVLSDILSKK